MPIQHATHSKSNALQLFHSRSPPYLDIDSRYECYSSPFYTTYPAQGVLVAMICMFKTLIIKIRATPSHPLLSDASL